MPLAIVLKAASVLAAAGIAAAGGASELGHGQASQSMTKTVYIYIVKPGDTLGSIAARFCGTSSAYRSLAAASHISNPNIIYPGKRIVLACHRRSSSTSTSRGAPARTVSSGSMVAAGQADIPATYPAAYSYYGLERLWVAAGGQYSARGTAACIAERESGGRTWAVGAAGERGLWQIHPSHGSLSTFYPLGNARAAVIISNNGSNWGQWTTRRGCGV